MGFYVEEPEGYQAALPDVVGPILRLGPRCSSSTWNTVILIAYKNHKNGLHSSSKVTCEWTLEPSGTTWQSLSDPIILDAHSSPGDSAHEWQFIRWVFPIVQLKEAAQSLQYRISVNASIAVTATIPIPALGEEWAVVAYSCYDQRRGVGHKLWDNIREQVNRGEPVHAFLGGGDQLYNDNVWMIDPLQQWLEDKDRARLHREPAEDTKQQIAEFYAGSYLRCLHFHPAADLFRIIPQVNTWDDHDTFDGWGSYPPKLQKCPLFRAIFAQSQRFYAMFQLGTTVALAESDGFHVVPPSQDCPFAALNFAAQLGPSLAVVAPDSRSQRSQTEILSDGTYKWLIKAMKQYPPEVNHVVLLSAIPILYPGLGILESLLKAFNHAPMKLLFKTGLYDSIYNHFDEPDLLDDVTDHWSSSVHAGEKVKLLEAFAAAASQCNIRVSIISGDVHLCALAYMQSKGKVGRRQVLDPGFITQIVTSAIGNKPPGNMVVSYIEQCTSVKSAGKQYQEGVAKFFDVEHTPSKSERFNNRQNYCLLKVEKPAGGAAGSPGNLNFKFILQGGDPITGNEILGEVGSSIPPLLPSNAAPDLIEQYQGITCIKPPKEHRHRCFCI